MSSTKTDCHRASIRRFQRTFFLGPQFISRCDKDPATSCESLAFVCLPLFPSIFCEMPANILDKWIRFWTELVLSRTRKGSMTPIAICEVDEAQNGR